jgi:hypothetical protein
MTCKHLDGSRCSLGLFGGRPSPGVCSICDRYEGSPRGAGDIVHSVTRATGLDRVAKAVLGDDCGCAKRRAALNAAIPFPDRREGDT